MHNISNIIKRNKPEVPVDFFHDFPKMILDKIQLVSSSTNEDQKPGVPADFFKNFYHQVADEIAADQVFEKYGIKKSVKPEVPVDYFDQNISSPATSQPIRKSRGRVYKITFWASVAAAAAGLLFLLLPGQNTPSIEPVIPTETAKTEISDEHLDTYADFIDEESMVEYIVENDVDLGESENDEVYDFVESEIEETYLDL
ncbi:MAG: hypothetical protein IPM74_07055 [Crocinitomicaceae bacterium]|nr:hypothetical protein [Crocinitomicaceae bacterium]